MALGSRGPGSSVELLYPTLPPGFVWDATGKVVNDPNARIQQVIGLIFSKFRETWKHPADLKWFRERRAAGVRIVRRAAR